MKSEDGLEGLDSEKRAAGGGVVDAKCAQFNLCLYLQSAALLLEIENKISPPTCTGLAPRFSCRGTDNGCIL